MRETSIIGTSKHKRIRARHIHAAEGFFDNVVGFIQNWIAILLIYNGLFGHDISLLENTGGGIIIFLISWARKYYIRRKGNSFIKRLYAKYELQEQAGEN